MRTILRLFTVAVVAALVTFGLQPPAHAAKQAVFTVWDASGLEFVKSCSNTPPYPCGTSSSGTLVQITVANRPTPSATITLGYQLENITATAPADYGPATTGTVTVAPYQYVTVIPIGHVNDGVTEPNETYRVRLTSSSVGGNISDTGITTIYDGGNMPVDCDLFRPDGDSFSITCTNRPPTEHWYTEVSCYEEWPMIIYVDGNEVIGNGTSTATCAGTGLPFRGWGYVVE